MKTSRCSVTCDNVTFLRKIQNVVKIVIKRCEMHVRRWKTMTRVVHAKNKIRRLSWRTDENMFFSTRSMIHSISQRFHSGRFKETVEVWVGHFLGKVWKKYPDGNKFQGTSCYYKSLETQGNVIPMTHYSDVI